MPSRFDHFQFTLSLDLTFQVPMQYFSLEHLSLLSPPDSSTAVHCFCCGSASSFLLELFPLLFSSGILGTYQPGEFIFQGHDFFAFSYCSWDYQGKNTEMVCHSLLQGTMFFSELSTMTGPSLVAPHSMAHELHWVRQAVIHVVSLVSFLCLWFSFCLPSDEWG